MENNPLNRMGLGRALLGLASRHPQLLYDLIDRHRKNVAITFHPDKCRGAVTHLEYADLYEPLEAWEKLTEEERSEAVVEYLEPVEDHVATGLRFLEARHANTESGEVANIQLELTQTKGSLHKALQLIQQKERELGAAQAALEFFNPERDLEVSGLVQGIRSLALGPREAGGNVSRLNGYTLFSHTRFNVVKVKQIVEEPKIADTTLAVVEEESAVSKVISKIRGRTKKPATEEIVEAKRPKAAYVSVRRVQAVSTVLYFIRSDSGLMCCTITLQASERNYWEDEAAAVDTLKSFIVRLRKRALAGDFTRPKPNMHTSSWVFLGHVVGQLDQLVKPNVEASSPKGNGMTVSTLCQSLTRDLARTIVYPSAPEKKVRPMTLLVVEPVLPDPGVRKVDFDIDIRFVYRQVTVQGGEFDPFYFSPDAPK